MKLPQWLSRFWWIMVGVAGHAAFVSACVGFGWFAVVFFLMLVLAVWAGRLVDANREGDAYDRENIG